MIGSCSPEQWVKVWKVDDWNTAKVRVEGKYPKITTWINGLKVCDFDGATLTTDKYEKQDIFEKLGPMVASRCRFTAAADGQSE